MIKRLSSRFLLNGILLIVFCSCLKEEALVASADFTFNVINDDYSVPSLVYFSNQSTGGESFEWTFEGGDPSTSTKYNPGEILYNSGGVFKIKLKVSNKDGSVSELERSITLEGTLNVDFDSEIEINEYAPVNVKLTNRSKEATKYYWTFEGGNPSISEQQTPPPVIFNTSGSHTITLETKNKMGDIAQKKVTILVKPTLATSFSTAVEIIDADFQVPVVLKTTNTSVSATSFLWEAPGSNIMTSTDVNPTFIYSTPGDYEIKLIATNGKQTQIFSKKTTFLPDTNLIVLNDVKFGINTASSIGCFYSTKEQKIYTRSEITEATGENIDLAFFGLNSSFTNNRYISPDETQNYSLGVIPNAKSTSYINKQETCTCSTISTTQFEAMTNDDLLKTFFITNQSVSFNNAILPRIVPFQTFDGRKGVVKIKSFVPDGINSYILVDIKVQKLAN